MCAERTVVAQPKIWWWAPYLAVSTLLSKGGKHDKMDWSLQAYSGDTALSLANLDGHDDIVWQLAAATQP
jgi:hypothetical protein